MMKLGIAPKLTLIFILFAGAVLIGLGIPAYNNGQEALKAAALSELLTTALEKEAALESWVTERQHGIGDIADQAHLQETISALLTAVPASVEAQIAKDDLVKDLDNWAGDGHRFHYLEVIDATSGRVFAATDAGQVGKFRENQPYFINGLKAAYVQNPYFDLVSQRPGMTAAAPIRSPDGQMIAVLAGPLNMDEMETIIQRRSDLHQTDEAFLVNTSNLYVTQPRLNPDPAVLQRGIHTEAIDLCLAHTSGTIAALDYRQIPAFIVYRWLPERQLCLIAKIDQIEALKPARSLASTMAMTGILVFLVGSILAFGLSRSIVRPVFRLVQGAEQIGQGNLGARIDSHSGDEIGKLAIAFNEMAAAIDEKESQLRKSALDLERRVQARTKELSASEERYRILSETSPDMIFVIDREDRVQYVNSRAAQQFGKTPEQVIGQARTAIFPPTIAKNQSLGLQHVMQTGQPVSSESPIVFPGGQLWLDTQLVPLRDEAGEVNAIMGVSRDITERKQAEEHIRSEKLLSDSIVNSLPGIFYLFDTQGRFLRWNRNFEQVSGYSAEEMVGRHPIDFFVGDDKDLVTERIGEAFVQGESQVEAVFTSRYGLGTDYLLTGVRVEINQQTFLIGTGIDISERKRSERISQSRLRILEYSADHSLEEVLQNTLDEVGALVNSPIGFYHFVDADQQTLTLQAWSTATLETYCEAEGVGMHYGIDKAGVWVDCVHQRRPVIHNDYAALPHRKGLPEGHASLNRELVVPIFRRGLIVAILGVGNKPGDYTAQDMEIVTFFADLAWTIVERKQAEDALQEANERFSLAARAASMGVWELDLLNNLLTWDDQVFQLYGVRKEDFSGAYEAWIKGVHPDDRERADEEVQQALQGEKEFDTEFRVVWPNGSIRHIKSYATVLRSQEGKPLRLTGVNYDITEEKVAEEKLNKLLDDLARSNGELERFAYVASHDLQEPLRMVTSYLQLLERRYRDKLDGDALEFINYAVDGSNRMKTLIGDLLAYSRVGTRGKELSLTDCEGILARVLNSLQISIAESQATVTHDPLPQVMADSSQLDSLFQNLIGNAIKFHGEEPPRIHFGVEQKGTEWVFSVRDNGIGIDPEYFERIFIIFQRLHNREQYPGTGIGLAISKRIVERHGGRMWIESQPNKGTTFFFTLPIRGEHA